MSALTISRRGLGLALAAASLPARALALAVAPVPVVTFHMDALHLDPSGTGDPYIPPLGLRSGAPVEHLDEGELRGLISGWA
jgi:hypothetical protein